MSDEIVVEKQVEINPLMERIKMPGETVRLPSGGLFYKNGELASSIQNGEVHVYPMSTYDEIVFKSPEKLINGSAVEEVFRRCIPDIQKPLELFAKDVDYLTTALKRVTFGPYVDVKFNHRCSESSVEHEYRADVNLFMQNTKIIDPTKLIENYVVNLPNGQVVEIIPIRFKSVIMMMQSASAKNMDITEQDLTDRLLRSLAEVIDAVDGIKSKNQIFQWLSSLNAGWRVTIEQAVEKSGDWGPDFTFTTPCVECGVPVQIEIPLNPVTFFT